MIENEHKICTKSSLQKIGGFQRLKRSSIVVKERRRCPVSWKFFINQRVPFDPSRWHRRSTCLHLIWVRNFFSVRNRLENSPRVSIRCYPIQRDRVIFHRSNPPLHYSFAYFALAYIHVFVVVWPAFGWQPRKICWWFRGWIVGSQKARFETRLPMVVQWANRTV